MDSVITKVQKHVDTLKAKNAKLADDNAKLKAQLAAVKQQNSRVRRIAKKPGGAPEPEAEAAPAPAPAPESS